MHALVVVPLRIFWASVLVPVLALSAAFAAVSFSANPAAMDTLAVGVGGACFAIYSCLLLSATSLQASATVARAATTFVGAPALDRTALAARMWAPTKVVAARATVADAWSEVAESRRQE